MVRPGEEWYQSMNKLWVKNKLSKYPFLKNKYGGKYNDFIRFCIKVYEFYGWQDIDNLIAEYNNGKFFGISRRRMYQTNVKKWYKIMQTVFERDNYTCVYCGKKGRKLEVDHVIPFSRGGTDDLNNLVTSCRHCNRQKRDKSKTEFLKWRKDHAD